MGYRQTKDDRMLQQVEQKLGCVKRKHNWLPKGRIKHLHQQIDCMIAIHKNEHSFPPRPSKEPTWLFDRSRYIIEEQIRRASLQSAK